MLGKVSGTFWSDLVAALLSLSETDLKYIFSSISFAVKGDELGCLNQIKLMFILSCKGKGGISN